jgi:hypothetical protein
MTSDTTSESNNSDDPEEDINLEEEFIENENEIIIDDHYTYSSTETETSSEQEFDTYDSGSNGVFIYENLNEKYMKIYEEETNFLEKEKINNNYYIGISAKYVRNEHFILVNSISAKSFLKYHQNTVIEYLKYFTGFYLKNPRLHIMQLNIDTIDETYNVILKTYWIRLIQRTWKNIYKKRKEVIENRKQIGSILYCKIYGRYRSNENYLPTIHGMLYKCNNKLVKY